SSSGFTTSPQVSSPGSVQIVGRVFITYHHVTKAQTCALPILHPLGQPLPSSGSRGRPLREPCGSPPSSVLWVSTTAPDPSVTPPVDPWGHVPPLMRRKSGALFGSWAIPVEHALG